jgi:hypothetical protein
MTVLDDTSQGWPLPHPDNPARLDAQRIRDTLSAIATLLETMATDAEVTAAVNAAVASLVDDAPDVLNTFKEFASALGDDPNYAATITAALAAKANSADLKAIATSGSYNDLSDTPTPPTLGTAAAKNTGTAVGDVVVIEDVDGSPGLPALVGKNLTGIVARPNWFDIATTNVSGSPTEIVFDDLDCEELLLFFKGIQCATSDTMKVAYSTDNGDNWTDFGGGSSLHGGGAGTSVRYGFLLASGLKKGNLVMTGGNLQTSNFPIYLTQALSTYAASTGAKINAIRIYTSGGAAFANTGSIEEQQR